MDLDELFLDCEDRMSKAGTSLEKEFAKLRTGRATSALIDGVKADYYGTPTPISQMASITVPDSRLTPVNDGKIIRITIPALTEERRKELVKVARKYSEDAKVAVRNVRRDTNDQLKKMEKEKLISEDERKKSEEDVQKLTDKYVGEIDKITSAKEKEILEI